MKNSAADIRISSLLAESLRESLHHSIRARAANPLLTGGADSPRILEIASETRTLIPLLSSVEDNLPLSLKNATAGMKRDYERKTFLDNVNQLSLAVEVSRALDRSRIPHCIMKGPIQQFAIYDCYFVRPAQDCDILVKREDFFHAIDVLARSEFMSDPTSTLWWDIFLGERHIVRGACLVDVHYKICQPGLAAPKDIEDFLGASINVGVSGALVPTLSIGHAALLSAISTAKDMMHRDSAAMHLCDLQTILFLRRFLTVEEYLSLAHRQNLRPVALFALRMLSASFGAFERNSECHFSRLTLGLELDELRALALYPKALSRWPGRLGIMRAIYGMPSAEFFRQAAWLGLSDLVRPLAYQVRHFWDLRKGR